MVCFITLINTLHQTFIGSVRLEEGTVKSLIEEKGVIKGVTYKNSAGEETTALAPLTVVCDGCYSNLRRSLNDNNVSIYAQLNRYVINLVLYTLMT